MENSKTKLKTYKIHFIILNLFFSLSTYALVDTKNGNYTKTYIDVSTRDFKLERMYNSRSLYNGLFGYGWCSNLETRLEVLPDNSLKVVECGGGLEIVYTSKKGASTNNKAIIQQIMQKVKSKKGLSRNYIAKVEKDLHQSPKLRSELVRVFGMKGKVKVGQSYHAVGHKGSVRFTGRHYRRVLADGTLQIFNKEGYVIQEKYKNNSWIKIKRKGKEITKIITAEGTSFQLRRKKKKNQLILTGPKTNIIYEVVKDDLRKVFIAGKLRFEHFYDKYHNLTTTRYSDNTYENLVYNELKDWVTGFKDRMNCREDYRYVSNPRNKDHYWTTVRKTCGKRVTNNSRYEFWNKQKPGKGGGKYLSRAKQSINGQVSDITYSARTGGPLSITRNNITTRYAYDPQTGLLSSRRDPGRIIQFSAYNRCQKPEAVNISFLKGKKVVRKIKTAISYDPKSCYLTQARQVSTGRWVVVRRDHLGRISEMFDQSKKKILVKYDDQFGKPKIITRPGVGSIIVAYNKEGKVDSTRSKTNPVVAAQVAGVFNGFLEIISPVVSNMSI